MDRAEWSRVSAMFEPSAAPRSRSGDWLAILRRDPRRAVEEEQIVCLICGARFRQLTNTHLRGHALSALEYKRRFGYNRGGRSCAARCAGCTPSAPCGAALRRASAAGPFWRTLSCAGVGACGP
jgi:ROS/MUCR transcriptional regulator protein